MRHVYALLLPIFVFSGSSFAQYLAKNSTAANPLLTRMDLGSDSQQWQKEQDQVNGRISNSNLAKMKNVTEAIVAYFQDSCITEGQFSPAWHGEYFSERTGPAQQLKFGAQCRFYEGKANLSIMANDLSPLLGHLSVNGQDFLTIKAPKDTKKNCAYFEYDMNSVSDANADQTTEDSRPMRSRIWLVAAGNGQLPYIPVSRAEYLREATLELTNMRNGIIAEMKKNIPLRPATVQEADKKAALEQLGTMYSGMDLQVRTRMFLDTYKTDEEYLKDNIDKGTADLDSTLHVMASLLNHLSPAQLAKPAIVSVEAIAFHGFEDGCGDKMLIRVNPACFPADGTREMTQFLLVRWQFDPSEAQANAIDRQMQERFDGQKLKDAMQTSSFARL